MVGINVILLQSKIIIKKELFHLWVMGIYNYVSFNTVEP